MLSLKENQPGLHGDCAELFTWLRGPHPLDEEVVLGYHEQVDGGMDASRSARYGVRRSLRG